MNEDNSIQPQEDKLISQAKKRLLGASVILFILLISAPFVLKNRNQEGPTEPIKISMESSPVVNESAVDTIKPPEPKQENLEITPPQAKKDITPNGDAKTKNETEIVAPSNSGLYIQLGIQTKIETIKINGVDKLRLITDEFKTEALARETMLKIKNAGVIGIIKKIS